MKQFNHTYLPRSKLSNIDQGIACRKVCNGETGRILKANLMMNLDAGQAFEDRVGRKAAGCAKAGHAIANLEVSYARSCPRDNTRDLNPESRLIKQEAMGSKNSEKVLVVSANEYE